MTIVPKKKSDGPRPVNKQGPENVVKQQQQQQQPLPPQQQSQRTDDGVNHPDGDQQLQPQQHPEPTQASGASVNQHLIGQDAVQVDDAAENYTGYNTNSSGDGDEHTHDRRHQQQHHHQHHHHHQQPHHHNQQQQQPHQHHHNKYANSKMSDNESNVNHVILITVINPHYPITCELIHQICSTYGKVNRIVIFKKNGVQTMVEFDSVDAAKRAKSMLHGCDIYSGCCTLKVEYAKTPKLNVHKNDSDSYDYTNPNLGSGPNHQASSESAPNDGNNQQQQHHHHLHAPNQPHVGHGGYAHGGPTAGHHQHHHTRDHPGMIKRGGSIGIGGGNDSMNPAGQSNSGPHHHHANQFHPNAAPHQHHPKPPHSVPSALGGALQSTSYIMDQPLDQSGSNDAADAASTFHHQDGGFNLARGSVGGTAGATNQANFGVDSFMTPSSGSGHHMNPHHGMHGSLYSSRQEGHHAQSHYQSHHLNARGSGPPGGGRGHHNNHNPSFPPGSLMAGGSHLAPQGTVMMVYGLGIERVNCDRLFNLFCLYGNVVRVKFLKSKEGCAMVQMGDVIAVDRCVSSLNKITLFGNEMQISYSKQAFLHEVMQPFTLPDGTPSFKDFMVNKNNRFRNPEVASKNKILPPSRILHFFNAPYGISDDELMMIFKQTAGNEPMALKIFTPKVENAKSFSGLVTFRDPTEATEALVLCNHLSLPKAGAPHPYILRLCFSPPAY